MTVLLIVMIAAQAIAIRRLWVRVGRLERGSSIRDRIATPVPRPRRPWFS